MLSDANLRHQEALDCAKGQKAEANFPFCPRSFDQAVMGGRERLGAASSLSHIIYKAVRELE